MTASPESKTPITQSAGDASPSCLTVDSVWKVFGSRTEEAVRLAKSGAERSTVLAKTGCTVAVRNVSFEVATGETFVVMGLSGSGKSTLVRCLARLADPTSGRVLLDGEDLIAMDADRLLQVRRAKMSMVFQHFGLFPHRRVVDNVAYGLEVAGVDKETRQSRALEVIEVVGLEGWDQHFPQELSGGMQQRVGLARALAVDPEIMFFDEPFSALDPLIRRDMQNELLRLQAELKRTIVFITHDFAEAIKLGDRIAIMKDGMLDQIGTAAELITNPATQYVREFTEDIPKAKVLTAGDVMHPTQSDRFATSVPGSTSIENLLPSLLNSAEPVGVVDENGRTIGSIDRSEVAKVLQV